jgi:uncharacterized protein YggE
MRYTPRLIRSPQPGLALGALITAALVCAAALGAPPRAAHADTSPTGITVSGQGIVTAPPDTATLQIGADAQASTVAAARDQAAQAANAVIAAVKADGVADQDIQTVQFSINPVYDTSGGRQVLRGYQVENVVQVKIRNLNSVGTIIDDAVAAGGNAVIVRSIAFSIENTDALLHQARLLAMQDAQNKAQDYATAAGVTLGRVINIQETQSQRPTPIAFSAPAPAKAVAAPPTPIESGTQQIQVTVTVTYAIQ